MLPSGSGQARLVRSVTRIWPRCGRTGALSPKSGASSALPRPAASTIFGAPIVSAAGVDAEVARRGARAR